MAIKGGTLILDFKDEEEISYDDEKPTQLKKDYYSMIKKSYGKKLMLINAVDSGNEYLKNGVVDITYTFDDNMRITFDFYVSQTYLYCELTEDNKIFIAEV